MAPAVPSSRAIPRPAPRLAPVTSATVSCNDGMRRSSVLPRVQGAAQLVTERGSESGRGGLAFGVFTHFLRLFRVLDGLGTEADAAAVRLNFEDDDRDLAA